MKELPKIFALQTLTSAPQDFVIHIVEMTQITRKMCLILNLVSVFCFAASICYIKFGPKCELNFHFPLSSIIFGPISLYKREHGNRLDKPPYDIFAVTDVVLTKILKGKRYICEGFLCSGNIK